MSKFTEPRYVAGPNPVCQSDNLAAQSAVFLDEIGCTGTVNKRGFCVSDMIQLDVIFLCPRTALHAAKSFMSFGA